VVVGFLPFSNGVDSGTTDGGVDSSGKFAPSNLMFVKVRCLPVLRGWELRELLSDSQNLASVNVLDFAIPVTSYSLAYFGYDFFVFASGAWSER